jgi:hypothetical protein
MDPASGMEPASGMDAGTIPEPASRHHPTVAELERWEDHGATWRTLSLDDKHVELELCTCYGEPVDRVASDDPEFIAFVRSRPHEGP